MRRVFRLPWAAWRDPDYINVDIPVKWDVSICRMNAADVRELSSEEIKHAILNPIGSPQLINLAKIKSQRSSLLMT